MEMGASENESRGMDKEEEEGEAERKK